MLTGAYRASAGAAPGGFRPLSGRVPLGAYRANAGAAPGGFGPLSGRMSLGAYRASAGAYTASAGAAPRHTGLAQEQNEERAKKGRRGGSRGEEENRNAMFRTRTHHDETVGIILVIFMYHRW